MPTKHILPYPEYLENLRNSRLLEEDALACALEEFRKRRPETPETSEPLSDYLIEAGKLTHWQHRRLATGVAKGFFLGQYKLLRRLGAGGMGSVYLAQHTMMDRLAALKVISATQVGAAALQRFRRESQVVASLDHPHIVRAHDYNRHGKYHYLVMEYVEGVDLDRYVRKLGPLTPQQAAEIAAQAADGLHFAHKSGVVHRDVKPSNLMLDRARRLKILDLGLARMDQRDEAEAAAGQAGVIGTVDFIAPEQAMDGHRVDARVDVYSLGCTLYFLLCGRVPFPGGSVAQKLMGHACRQPAAIRTLRREVPEELVEICNRMMAKKPEQRYATAEEAKLALQGFLADLEETSHRLEYVQTADESWNEGSGLNVLSSSAPRPSADTLIVALDSTSIDSVETPAPQDASAPRTEGAANPGPAIPGVAASAVPSVGNWAVDPGSPTHPSLAGRRDPGPLGLDVDVLTSASSWSVDSTSPSFSPGPPAPRKDHPAPRPRSVDAWRNDPAPMRPEDLWPTDAREPAPLTDTPFGPRPTEARSPSFRFGEPRPADPAADGGAAWRPASWGPSHPSSPIRDAVRGHSNSDDLFAFLASDVGTGSSVYSSSDSSLSARPPRAEHDPEWSSMSLTRPPGANFTLGSMIVRVVCPHCRARLAVAGGAPGEALDCPKCGKPLPR